MKEARALGFAAALMLTWPAWGQHPGHAEHHGWYKDLKQPGRTASCCDNQDCRPARARPTDVGWEVYLDGFGWVPVPPKAILPDHLNQHPLSAHVCAHGSGYIYCFLRGSAGG